MGGGSRKKWALVLSSILVVAGSVAAWNVFHHGSKLVEVDGTTALIATSVDKSGGRTASFTIGEIVLVKDRCWGIVISGGGPEPHLVVWPEGSTLGVGDDGPEVRTPEGAAVIPGQIIRYGAVLSDRALDGPLPDECAGLSVSELEQIET